MPFTKRNLSFAKFTKDNNGIVNRTFKSLLHALSITNNKVYLNVIVYDNLYLVDVSRKSTCFDKLYNLEEVTKLRYI